MEKGLDMVCREECAAAKVRDAAIGPVRSGMAAVRRAPLRNDTGHG